MNLNLTKLGACVLLLAAIAFSSARTQAQVAIPASAKVTADTTKPGFKWNIFANSANQANTDVRPENALAGLLLDADGNPLPNLADPTVQGVALAPATAPSPGNAPIKFEISSVINVSIVDQDSKGNFTPDGLMPGVPATDGSNNGLSVEILTYLDLPAGVTTMGVNSDDGFVTASGNVIDALGRVTVGSYVGGRGAGDTIFTFSVAEAGVYPFRTVYEQGGGDANIEWFTVKADGTKVLVNDTANGGIKAYRERLGTIDPYIKLVSPSPVPRQLEQVSSSLAITLSDGNPKTVDDNSIVLQFDGATVTPTKARQGTSVTLTYTPSGLLLPGDQHTANLTFKDSTGTSRTQQWSFYNMENLILPASPVVGENFDSYPEATSAATTVPPGWVATNFTFPETSGWDLTDVKSDAYLDWVLITTDTVLPIEDEVLDNDKTQLINGQPVTNWMSGNLIFVASDGRASKTPEGALAPQLQIVVSKPFNLSTVTNPVLTFSSGARLSIGNPDQMTMEYSVDGGTNWLPVIYMRSSSTLIFSADGSYDALAMFNKVDTNQVPQWPTPGVGPLGGKWGDMLAAPISQALAPYIANRNDGIAARRVEAIRLPQASKKADVRLRLTHLSHCGWEWGVDNIAFYDLPSSVQPPPGNGPTISVARSGNSITLSWPSSVTGFTLEGTGSLSNPTWTAVPGVVNNSVTVPTTTGNQYYRLRQ